MPGPKISTVLGRIAQIHLPYLQLLASLSLNDNSDFWGWSRGECSQWRKCMGNEGNEGEEAPSRGGTILWLSTIDTLYTRPHFVGGEDTEDDGDDFDEESSLTIRHISFTVKPKVTVMIWMRNGDTAASQWKMTRRCTIHWLGAFSNPCHTLNADNDDGDYFPMLIMMVMMSNPNIWKGGPGLFVCQFKLV